MSYDSAATQLTTVDIKDTAAQYIIIIEKEGIFHRLCEAKFFKYIN